MLTLHPMSAPQSPKGSASPNPLFGMGRRIVKLRRAPLLPPPTPVNYPELSFWGKVYASAVSFVRQKKAQWETRQWEKAIYDAWPDFEEDVLDQVCGSVPPQNRAIKADLIKTFRDETVKEQCLRRFVLDADIEVVSIALHSATHLTDMMKRRGLLRYVLLMHPGVLQESKPFCEGIEALAKTLSPQDPFRGKVLHEVFKQRDRFRRYGLI